MKSKHYNVFVIGSGIAGQTAAIACAEKGLSVAISDNREFGGTCANRGCDPKKVLIQFSDLLEQTQRLKGLGVSKLPEIDWKAVQNFKSQFVDAIPKNTETNLKDLNIDLYHQSPEFVNENEILVEGKSITADYFVIATGNIPRELPIPGNEYLETSDAILDLEAIPKSASFIGSGYIGMEFATMLSILGCKITVFDYNSSALSHFDPFLVAKLQLKMEELGVTFVFNAEVTAIEKLNKNLRLHYTLSGKKHTHKSRNVFNTAGRVPSIGMLNLENANIDYDDSGIIVNAHLQSKTNARVYACGDVSNASLPLTPLSGLQGSIVGKNITYGNVKAFQFPIVPSTVFTQPNIASVGLSEDDAKKRYKDIIVYKGNLSHGYNAKKENAAVYAYKILVNKRTETIVGAHLLSAEANETINIFVMAMAQEMTVSEFKRLIFTYPSYSIDLKYMLKN
ncbi:NAD(P)/FAD-dependent oxidoreductase [Bizionia gelidisalsuginis]|uniref:NAD(P)/FAD-dependent oxidoreductase n=1 Tax=Bizionia gelidisalsuginis TaxID=291188 RepID=A0ABY3MCD8_9FLAO|nr:NAD(P)/FAD-dependent oxidoreductase [Bizionia gelidisalsuginis]TYC15564.1 NAD(P)/FAD-dependent oxidoreductase [Bizionia gelidisalsuginis]